ncbi:hypothetical protein HRR99_05180 [Agrobacterium vaccinii]|uniref:hypothetical protein n=1 Tax=Agrobacterium vaccinii TaxID=2735528 RepID=UPI001E4CE152|nr:hypothetical protein [Agrobacterium vaccinii]UHS60953.1 hypothetical protein HRR99_05180 [Agrobacterium vaccinii]
MNHAEAFVRDQISATCQSLIPTTLKTAYQTAKVIIANEPVFSVPSAEDNHGRIIQWCVDFAFVRLITTGQWNFEYAWRHFEKPTGRYLEIRPTHSCVTISQVNNPKKQPRDVRFRENMRLQSQTWLAGLAPPEVELRGLPHILLMHGHKTLDFAHLALPKGEHENGFHYRSGNLMRMPHAIPEQEVPVEDTDYDSILSLKDEIDKWRKDHG